MVTLNPFSTLPISIHSVLPLNTWKLDYYQACCYSRIQINIQETSQEICIDSWYRAVMRSNSRAGRTARIETLQQSHGRSRSVSSDYLDSSDALLTIIHVSECIKVYWVFPFTRSISQLSFVIKKWSKKFSCQMWPLASILSRKWCKNSSLQPWLMPNSKCFTLMQSKFVSSA